MKVTRRQLKQIIREAMSPIDPKIKRQLISWWNGIREEGEKYTWRDIRDDVMATLPESGHGIGLTRYIDTLSLEEVDVLFQSVFAKGAWRK